MKSHAEARDRTGDLQIFSLTPSQLSYRGCHKTEINHQLALSQASDHPKKGTGRYVVDLNNGLLATLVVHGGPVGRIFDTHDHPWTRSGVNSGVAIIGFAQSPTLKAFLLLPEGRFHKMP